jgi:hypothetical protein
MTQRDDLRAKLFSSKPRSKIVAFNDVEVEVRQPPVKAILEGTDNTDKRAAIVKLLISYCFVPGTNERVFEDADYDSILEMPFGNDWIALSSAIDSLIDINKEVKAQEKN